VHKFISSFTTCSLRDGYQQCRFPSSCVQVSLLPTDFHIACPLHLSPFNLWQFYLLLDCTCPPEYPFKSRLQTIRCSAQRQRYLTADGQSTSLSWYQATVWYPRPHKFSVYILGADSIVNTSSISYIIVSYPAFLHC
jgi:hypothetical protein